MKLMIRYGYGEDSLEELTVDPVEKKLAQYE
jgi:hypothetical protein